MPLHIGKGRSAGTAITRIIDYVENPDKTDHSQLISSYQCDSRIADAQFALSKKIYLQQTGRTNGEKDVIAYHLRQAFLPGEVTAEEANRIGQELAQRFTKGNHAYIVCTHVDRHHVHNHIIWNSTSLDCTQKFRNFWGSTKAVRQLSDQICIEHGLSVLDEPAKHGKTYNIWRGAKPKEPTRRDELRAAIDDALEQKPENLEKLLELLTQTGYEIKLGKDISIKGGRQKKYIRLSSLGEAYSLKNLSEVLAGNRTHTPQPRIVVVKKVNLIIDIDQKLRDGKGGGYKQWASVFNAKQIAQTYNYLREFNLMDKSDLDAKATRLSARAHEIKDQIDAISSRQVEIGDMKKQIIAYNKTRSVFQEYKASGYSKKFYTEHREEIEQHRAAKRFFNEHQLDKLPSVKSLQDEYGQLQAQKSHLYAEYKKANSEAKEALTVQANVNRILGTDVVSSRKENERDR